MSQLRGVGLVTACIMRRCMDRRRPQTLNELAKAANTSAQRVSRVIAVLRTTRLLYWNPKQTKLMWCENVRSHPYVGGSIAPIAVSSYTCRRSARVTVEKLTRLLLVHVASAPHKEHHVANLVAACGYGDSEKRVLYEVVYILEGAGLMHCFGVGRGRWRRRNAWGINRPPI